MFPYLVLLLYVSVSCGLHCAVFKRPQRSLLTTISFPITLTAMDYLKVPSALYKKNLCNNNNNNNNININKFN